MAEVKQLDLRKSSSLAASRRPNWSRQRASLAIPDRFRDDFDAAAWMAIIEEQKLLIAHAAGVDPAKVRIRIGH